MSTARVHFPHILRADIGSMLDPAYAVAQDKTLLRQLSPPELLEVLDVVETRLAASRAQTMTARRLSIKVLVAQGSPRAEEVLLRNTGQRRQ